MGSGLAAGVLLVLVSLAGPAAGPVAAQVFSGVDPFEDLRIEAVRIDLVNPSLDTALNERVRDRVRRDLGLFPGERFSRQWADFSLSRARQLRDIAATDYAMTFGSTGGVVLRVTVTLADPERAAAPRGALATGRIGDLPVLYDDAGTFAKLRLEGLSLYYGNADAWFGRPDALPAGNPLVQGRPSGAGYSDWIESWMQAGVYGITPITPQFSVYGGLSAILSGSAGQELFTDEPRSYLAVEDAYAGFITGTAGPTGDRFVLNASLGRQRFLLGDGFLIANTSANGWDRAALQSNPRWAADMLGLVQIAYNDSLFEVFYLDPDELPVVDSDTRILGANLEITPFDPLSLGASLLYAPQSEFAYFTFGETLSRAGLQVADARVRWQPNPQGMSGPFLSAEAAIQTNRDFPMRATAATGEIGYVLAGAPWSPTLSYRYARFSGDDPDTARFERWDPLLSGGNGEQWVQGINDFKVYQNSNLEAHRLQARLRPLATVELVPQAWLFRAVSETNLGGNPALSVLDGKDIGSELNLTVKWFPSQDVFVQGHVAATFPGDAVEAALDGRAEDWWSTMLFIRLAL
jgi:hypothetical protein